MANFIKFIKERQVFLVLILLLVLGLAVYGNSFCNILFWDDDDLVTNNTYIKDWSNFPAFFTQNLIAGAGQMSDYWRPFLLISFAADYSLWELKPFGFHLTNTILHIVNAFLIFLIFYLLNKKKIAIPLVVSLFFLVHPLQTEAVTYIAGRADPLSSLFCLLAILLYITHRREHGKSFLFYCLALLFFVCGLLTKEQVVLMPLIILAIDVVYFLKRRDNFWMVVGRFLPFFIIAAVYLFLRLTILDFNDTFSGSEYGQNYDSSILNRFFTFCLVVISYLKLLFFPFGLHMAREVPVVTDFFSWPVVTFAILLLSVIFICVKTWKDDKNITFGFIWLAIILAPRTNVFPINRPMYEHWMYLPMIGFWLFIVSLSVLLLDRISDVKARRKCYFCAISLTIIFIAYFSVLTVLRNRDWRNPIVFYEKNLRYTPGSFIQHNNLGMAYSEAGLNEQAVDEYNIAISINDEYPQVHYNLGNSLYELGRLEEAIEEYEKSIAMSPSFFYPYKNLLSIYIELGEIQEAEKILKAIRIMFGESDYFYLKGMMEYSIGNYRQAIADWRSFLEINPGNNNIEVLIYNTKILINSQK